MWLVTRHVCSLRGRSGAHWLAVLNSSDKNPYPAQSCIKTFPAQRAGSERGWRLLPGARRLCWAVFTMQAGFMLLWAQQDLVEIIKPPFFFSWKGQNSEVKRLTPMRLSSCSPGQSNLPGEPSSEWSCYGFIYLFISVLENIFILIFPCIKYSAGDIKQYNAEEIKQSQSRAYCDTTPIECFIPLHHPEPFSPRKGTQLDFRMKIYPLNNFPTGKIAVYMTWRVFPGGDVH